MKTKFKRESGRLQDETSMEYLRRLVYNCDMETESLLDDLPSVQAVIDYFELWHTYDTDFLQGIVECIQEGDSPKPYVSFVKKYRLTWDTHI